MSISIEAIFKDGAFTPAAPVDLPEGAQVRLTVEAIDGDGKTDPLAEVIGIGDSGRPDGADNHDKYLYGQRS